MRARNDLHQLIMSLTKAEKRQFKLTAAKYEGRKNYLRLFDAIERQDTYDEPQIREMFRNEAFLKQLHVAKRYLSDLIMKSLRAYHANRSVDAKLKVALFDCEILLIKGLYAQCQRALNAAYKLAVRYEKQAYIILILEMQRNALISEYGSIKAMQRLPALLDDEQRQINALYTINHYWSLCYNAFQRSTAENSDASQRWGLGPPPPADALIKDERLADSYQAKVLFHHLNFTYHFMNGDRQAAFSSASQLVDFMERHSEQIHEEPARYATALQNLAGLCLHLQRYERLQTLLAKIRALPSKYALSAHSGPYIKIMLRMYNIELEWRRDTGQFNEGIALISEIEAFFRQFDDELVKENKLLLSFQFAYLYFGAGNFRRSMYWLSKILNEREYYPRTDIYAYARILNLIVHYELRNFEHLEHIVRSTQRFLSRKSHLFRFESIILEFFARVGRLGTEAGLKDFYDLQQKLTDDSFRAMFEQALDYVNVDAWVESKLNSTPFSSLVRWEKTQEDSTGQTDNI